MVAPRFHFVVVLFTLQVHQVQLINQAEFLQQFNGSIHRRTVNILVQLASLFQ